MRTLRARLIAVRERYGRARERVDTSTAGQLQRRLVDLALMNQALILSALALMLFVPALITLAALLPLGEGGEMASGIARRVDLSAMATHYLQQLLPDTQTVRAGTTGGGAVLSLLVAYSWPAALKRGYETIWGLPSRGRRDLWRTLVWLLVFFAVVVAASAFGQIGNGFGGLIGTALVGLPAVAAWAWWGQYLLLAGRVSWRALLPGAVALALGLTGLRLFLHFYLSRTIESEYLAYGPIGVVFVLQSWLIAFSLVMLGAPLLGHFISHRRTGATTIRDSGVSTRG
jgi:membrane protein